MQIAAELRAAPAGGSWPPRGRPRRPPPAVPASRRALLACPQAARRPHPPRAGHAAPRRTRPPARAPRSGPSTKLTPTREHARGRGSRGNTQIRPPGPGPPGTSANSPLCQPQATFHKARPRKIVFEDELNAQARLGTKKPTGAVPGGHMLRPHPPPDYELKYPAVSSERERIRYVAVFQDQHGEFLVLQQEVGAAQAKLQQLEALLNSLPPPRSQKEAQVAARVWSEFEKKWMDPGFLDKQLRCRYLKGKLRHLKTQIQKFDDQRGSEGSVYF